MAIDTNVLIDLLAGEPGAARRARDSIDELESLERYATERADAARQT